MKFNLIIKKNGTFKKVPINICPVYLDKWAKDGSLFRMIQNRKIMIKR